MSKLDHPPRARVVRAHVPPAVRDGLGGHGAARAPHRLDGRDVRAGLGRGGGVEGGACCWGFHCGVCVVVCVVRVRLCGWVDGRLDVI